jgi:hypothetical protein
VRPAPLPPGAVLLHVGPHKTGTTALQYAAAFRRDELAAAGVVYPARGKQTHHSRAAMSIAGRYWGWKNDGGEKQTIEAWDSLVEQVAAAPDRAFVSSEFFDELTGELITKAIDELGRDRVHVVVTLRPLSKILPSAWQQHVKSGLSRPFDLWLESMLSDPPDPKVTPAFWLRQDHGALVSRWAAEAGPENTTVIVLDDKDHSMLPRTFESLLGIKEGLLDPQPGMRINRSMTFAESEVIRRANRTLTGRSIGWQNYERIIRMGAVVRMVEAREPAADEARLTLPYWAKVRASEIGAQHAAMIKASGVRVIGDLDKLVPDPGKGDASDRTPIAPPETVPTDVAVEVLLGSVSAAVGGGAFLDAERIKRSAKNPLPPVPPTDRKKLIADLPLREVTTGELVSVTKERVLRAVKRRFSRG